MLLWPDCSLAPWRGSIWLVPKPTSGLYQFLDQPRNSISFSFLQGWYRGDHGQTPLYHTEEGRICPWLHSKTCLWCAQQGYHYLCSYRRVGITSWPSRNSHGSCQSPYLERTDRASWVAEKSAKKFEPSTPKGKWGMSSKGRGDMAQSSQAKGKETMYVELSGDWKTPRGGVNRCKC